MKILNSVSTIYRDIYQEYNNLKKEVDLIIENDKKRTWYYFSRLKEVQSYALKLETGRVQNPKRPEDFFACTIVVENLNEINNALDLIRDKFEICYRRPDDPAKTHKEPSDFPFDDLRLYLTIKSVDYLPKNPVNELVFELQLKTFLQHAWGIATHDLIYKSGNVSWSKERVAFQTKAMLEQAEVSISGAEYLAGLPELAKETERSILMNNIYVFLTGQFQTDALPADLLGLSKIVKNLLNYFKLDVQDLNTFLNDENKAGRGVAILDLSPYSIILQSIINQRKSVVELFLSSKYRFKKHKLFIPSELEIADLRIEEPHRILRT